MNSTPVPDPSQNPYDPYDETDRYRAYRDGWTAQREGSPRTANPYSFSQVSEALAWLDGWTAAVGRGGRESIGRRKRAEARQLEGLDFVWDRSAETVDT